MVDRVKRTPEGSSLPGFHNVILTVHITPEIWTAVVTEEEYGRWLTGRTE